MTTRFIETDRDLRMLHLFIDQQPLPLTVSLSKAGKAKAAE